MPPCKPLEPQELSAIANTFSKRTGERNTAVLFLGCQVGFRVSELLALRVGDVLCRGKMRDAITLGKSRMKGRRVGRTIPLTPESKRCVSILISLVKRKGCYAADAFLIQSERRGNTPISREHFSRILQEAARKAGVRGQVATHSMRKTFAVNVHSGFNARQIAGERIDPLICTGRALGHKSLQSTAHYLPASHQLIDEVILSLGKLINFNELNDNLASKLAQKPCKNSGENYV